MVSTLVRRHASQSLPFCVYRSQRHMQHEHDSMIVRIRSAIACPCDVSVECARDEIYSSIQYTETRAQCVLYRMYGDQINLEPVKLTTIHQIHTVACQIRAYPSSLWVRDALLRRLKRRTLTTPAAWLHTPAHACLPHHRDHGLYAAVWSLCSLIRAYPSSGYETLYYDV